MTPIISELINNGIINEVIACAVALSVVLRVMQTVNNQSVTKRFERTVYINLILYENGIKGLSSG